MKQKDQKIIAARKRKRKRLRRPDRAVSHSNKREAETMKKITMATLKSFIRKNTGKLYIKNKSDFNARTDGIEQCENRGFREVEKSGTYAFNNLGIRDVWCVGHSCDYFEAYAADGFTGIEVTNCCGNFILAVKA